jgi:hypothetical protein
VSIQDLREQDSMAREHVKSPVRIFKREDKRVPRACNGEVLGLWVNGEQVLATRQACEGLHAYVLLCLGHMTLHRYFRIPPLEHGGSTGTDRKPLWSRRRTATDR